MPLTREYSIKGTADCAKAIFIKHFDQAKLSFQEINDEELMALPITNFLTAQHPLAFASSIKVLIIEKAAENLSIKAIVSLRGFELFALVLWITLMSFISIVCHWILQIEWTQVFFSTFKVNILATLGIFLLYILIRLSIEKHLEIIITEIKSLMQD
jgi:hypothetical protein